MPNKFLLFDSGTNTVSNVTNLVIPGLKTTGLNYNVHFVDGPTYTAQSMDDVLLCNNGGMTVFLPNATSTGKQYNIKNVNVASMTIDANVYGSTIDGELTLELDSMESVTLIDANTNAYYVI